jgi:hypothetical protein
VLPEDALLRPDVLYPAEAVLGSPGPIPESAGVYAWYFSRVPPRVPTGGCHVVGDAALLYVGISPKAPPANGRPPSRQTVRSRVRYHYRGNAEGSTLRLTLGCLLADELGISLRRVGSGTRMTFGREGEARLSAWMASHARVAWTVTDCPWELARVAPRPLRRARGLPLSRHAAVPDGDPAAPSSSVCGPGFAPR